MRRPLPLRCRDGEIRRIYVALVAGFAPIPCWSPYAADERSVCLKLVL